jgi:hypothetical protein
MYLKIIKGVFDDYSNVSERLPGPRQTNNRAEIMVRCQKY